MRDLSIAYLLVTLTYLYIGVLVFASFPSPPLPKDCIEQVSSVLLATPQQDCAGCHLLLALERLAPSPAFLNFPVLSQGGLGHRCWRFSPGLSEEA